MCCIVARTMCLPVLRKYKRHCVSQAQQRERERERENQKQRQKSSERRWSVENQLQT